MRILSPAAVIVLGALAAAPAGAQIVIDNFNANTSANYILNTTPDTATTFAFDYSTMGIPVAPSTTDFTTLGLKLEANISSATISAVTLHTVQTFTGDYIVKFDAWINANGPFPLGGTGSTEFLTCGVGGNGLSTNGAGGSGAWFAASGEGQSTRDYRGYKNAGEQFAESGQFRAGLSSAGGSAHNSSDPYYASFGSIDVANLPVQGANNAGPAQQTGVTAAGTFGFAWHQVEIRVDADGGTGGATTAEWFIDGLSIARLDAGIGSSFSTDGSVTLGYMDIFTSVSNNASLSFGLIDNLMIADLATADAFGTNPAHPTFGTAVLGTNSRPILGTTFGFDLAYAGPAPEPGILIIGGAPASIPFFDGTLLTSPPWTTVPFTTTPPTTPFAFPIPFDPTLLGGIASAQALILDLIAPATPNSLVFSSALAFRLGL